MGFNEDDSSVDILPFPGTDRFTPISDDPETVHAFQDALRVAHLAQLEAAGALGRLRLAASRLFQRRC